MYVTICFSKGGLFGLLDKQTPVSRGRVDCAVDVAYFSDFSALKRAVWSPNRTEQDQEYKRKQKHGKATETRGQTCVSCTQWKQNKSATAIRLALIFEDGGGGRFDVLRVCRRVQVYGRPAEQLKTITKPLRRPPSPIHAANY